MVDRRVRKAAAKRDKPPISKKALERLVTINNGGEPVNQIKRSGSEEPLFAPQPATSSSTTSTLASRPKEADVTNVKPAIQKPNFDFAALRAQSSLMGQLPSFLDQMKAANAELEVERKAGTLANRKIEIDDTSSEGESSSDEDDDEDETEGAENRNKAVKESKVKEEKKEKKEKKERGQYIEMNLGLGVLEEKNSEDETSSSGSSEEESEDEDMGGMTVMDKLQGTDKEEVGGRKKAGIEVVKET